MRKIYTPAHINFLKANIKGRSQAEMAALFNRRFKMSLSKDSMKTLLARHRISNGHGRGIPQTHRRKYQEKHLAYLRKIVPGTPYSAALEKFNEKFGLSVGANALKTICKKHGILNGLDTRFSSGHVSHNKGRKGYCPPGSEKGWFQPGHEGKRTRPVGSERVNVDGYLEVKISDIRSPDASVRQKNWRGKHLVVWEKANGPVPKGSMVIFLDGDRKNVALKNLFLISRKAHAVMCSMGWYTKDREATKANCLIASIKVAATARKRETFESVKTKKMVFLDNNGSRVYVTRDRNRYVPVRETRAGGAAAMRAKGLGPKASRGEAQRALREYAAYRGWMRV